MGFDDDQLLTYYDVDVWIDELSKVDFVLSARIHGGMAAIAASTPVVFIPTDLRIRELVDVMKLPSLDMNTDLPKNPSDLDLLQMLNVANVDYRAFEENRRHRLAQYRDVLAEVGLEINPNHLAILNQHP